MATVITRIEGIQAIRDASLVGPAAGTDTGREVLAAIRFAQGATGVVVIVAADQADGADGYYERGQGKSKCFHWISV